MTNEQQIKHPKPSIKATIEHKDTKATIETDNISTNELAFVAIIAIVILAIYVIKKKGN